MIPWTQEPQRGKTVARPKTGQTPGRHIRIDDELWGQIGEIAREQGRTTTAVVVDALRRYVTWYKRQQKTAERAGAGGTAAKAGE
jgi:predicted transcriptional regulator